VVNATPLPVYTGERERIPTVQEARRTLGSVWTGAENLAPPRFDPRTAQPVARRYTDYVNGGKAYLNS
jgi:hypothetical protein